MSNLLKLIPLAILLVLAQAVTFESLYNKQLKSSYGFEILKYYHDEDFGNHGLKHYKGESLLYLAPWRTRGMDIALKYIQKFDYFVPCYYDLQKRLDPEQIQLVTSEHFSQEYLEKIKEKNPSIKILPRLYVHGTQGDVFYMAGFEEQHMARLLDYIREILMNPLYDGILLASTFITPNTKFPWSTKDIVKAIRGQVTAANKLLFISMEGVDNKPDRIINKKKARELIDLADKLLIANYDYPKGSVGGIIPVSPIDWIRENFDFYCDVYGKSKLVKKLIMTIPLYGYYVALFGKYDPLQGSQFLAKLQSEKQAWMEWVDEYQECMIGLNKLEYLFFPCLHFLDKRLRYFEELGVGVGAFEAGSSLEIFFQMF